MMIQQTIDIPADRRIHLDLTLPETVPSGKSDLCMVFVPVQAKAVEQKVTVSPPAGKKEHNNAPLDYREASIALAWGSRPDDSSRKYAGCLKGKGIFKGDPVE
ncbi:MAG: hypothetical protein LBT11_05615, partial [Treponema sp.]|nr:hypothetical protein [Treponema sp.]